MWHHVGNYCAVLGLRSWTCAPARSLSIVSARHLHSAQCTVVTRSELGHLSSSVADFVAVLNPLVNSVLNHKNTSDP